MRDSADKKAPANVNPRGGRGKSGSPTPQGPMRSPLMKQVPAAGSPGSSSAAPVKSPMITSGSPAQSPPPGSPQGQPHAASDQKPFAKAEISAITGVKESRYETIATSLSFHMFDRTRQKRKISIKLAFVVLAMAAVLALILRPQGVRELWFTVHSYSQTVMHQIRPPRKPQKTTMRSAKAEASKAKLREKLRPSVLPQSDSCLVITRAMNPADRSLNLGDRIIGAECYLALDEPRSAEEILSPLKTKLQASPEAIINRQKSSGTLADAQQILVSTYLKMAKVREAEDLVRGQCQQWQQTNTCVAKLLIHANRAYDATNLKGLFEINGRLDAKAQARLWYAGAQLATQDNRHTAVDQRYAMALKSAPRDALALRKHIYEAQALNLYQRGELLRLKVSTAAAQADLAKLDSKAKIKLVMLNELVTSTDKARTLKKILTREDITYRARSDVDFVDILGPESLRYGLETDYLKLLSRTRAQYKERFTASASVLKRISWWETRARFSEKNFDQAFQTLSQHAASFGQDAVTRHFFGVLSLVMDTSSKSARMAIEHFQEALRAKGNWESRYALGIALLRAGTVNEVPLIIRDLENSLKTPDERFWTDMLKAHFYVSSEKYSNAIEILKSWIAKQPGFDSPRELLVDVLRKIGNKTGAEEQQRALDDLRRRQAIKQAPDVFASPLGALAYERRPLN